MKEKILFFEEWQTLAEFCEPFTFCIINMANFKNELYSLLLALDKKMHADSIEDAESSIQREIFAGLDHNLSEHNYFSEKYTAESMSYIFKVGGEILNLNFMPHPEDLNIRRKVKQSGFKFASYKEQSHNSGKTET